MKDKTKRQLENILMFSKRVQKRMENVSLAEFLVDDLLQDSVLFCLGYIGEVATDVRVDEKKMYPGVYWKQMIGLRNRLFHNYEKVNLSIRSKSNG